VTYNRDRVVALIFIALLSLTGVSLAKTNTSTSLSSSANPSTYGSSVTFTATVTPSAAPGTVTFKDGSTTLGTGTLSSGKATLSKSTLTAGSHSITASYGGDTNNNSSTSSALTQTVNKANSTVTLSSSVNPSTYNSSVKFTVTVTPATCTGTVTFNDSSTTVGTSTLSSGKATFSTSTLTAGSHSITASYPSNSNCNSSTSSTLSQTVNKANSSVALSSSANPSVAGSSVTFTATVSPSTATGSVTFKDGTTTLGTGNVSSGKATFSTSALALGSHSITGAYSGDGNYNGSTPSKLTQTVKKASAVTLSSSTNPCPFNAPVTFTALVSPSAATGTVTFFDGSTSLGTGTLSSGVATFSTSALALGSHSITASYAGDSNYAGSASSVLTQNVLNLTSISVTPASVSLPVGATQQFTATATFSDGSHGNITMSATWSSSATIVATVSAVGVATASDEGTTTIQAAVGNVSNSATLTDTPSRFRFTGNLLTPRFNFTATLLQNGKVLIVGGLGLGSLAYISECELYDPTTGTFSQTGRLNAARFNHTATLLSNGMVLVAGGQGSDGMGGITTLASAELYDPTAGTFSPTGSLNFVRANQTATLLSNGTVLIAGGNRLAAAGELYSIATGSFSLTGSLNTPRGSHAATLLNDGTVLIAGGADGSGAASVSAEIYNSTTGIFTTTGSMNAASIGPTATLLGSGKVIVAAGYNSTAPLARTEIYDPIAKSFSLGPSLATAREEFTATLLGNGQVLFVGGCCNGSNALASAELYDPSSGTISGAGNLNVARFFHVAASLNNGMVLLASGGNGEGIPLNSAETYQSTTAEPAPASLRITPSVANIPVGGTQQFTALDNYGNPRLDVTWTVSNPSLASVTPDEDNAAILSALATGQVTLTANAEGVSAQEQVTILSSSSFVPGTVVWSSPPLAGYSALQLAQAVPSNNGPDLYSTQISADGTQSIIQALKADGEQLWQTTMPPLNSTSVPDGFGGLIVTEYQTCTPGQTHPMTVVDLDGATGQPLWQATGVGVNNGNGTTYCFPTGTAPEIAVAGDGSAYIVEPTNAGFSPLTHVFPNGAMQTSSFPGTSITNNGTTINVQCCVGPPMVSTDGNMYLEYEVRNIVNNVITSDALYLYHSDNVLLPILLSSTTQNEALLPGPIIPDGQGGVLATWTISPSNPPIPPPPNPHTFEASHVVGGAAGAPYDLPFDPHSVTGANDPFTKKPLSLVLGENGIAFAKGIAAASDGSNNDADQIASFNISSGATNWKYQSGAPSTLSILAVLSDGSLVINDSQNGTVLLSPSGASSPLSGPLGGIPQYSWTERWSVPSTAGVSGLFLPLEVDSASAWATPKGNASQNGAAISLCPCLSQTGNSPSSAMPMLETLDIPAGFAAASSTTTTYLQLIGDQGINTVDCPQDVAHCHDMGQRFILAAANEAATLTQSGSNVAVPVRVSSVQDVAAALTNNGPINGTVTYFGHGGQLPQADGSYLSVLAVGQGQGQDTNVSFLNYTSLSSVQLSSNTAIILKTCHAGLPPIRGGGHSIAQLLANQLNRGVYAWKVGFFFSHNPNATAPHGMPSETQPMYFFPEGGSNIAPCAFLPNQPEPQKCGGEK